MKYMIPISVWAACAAVAMLGSATATAVEQTSKPTPGTQPPDALAPYVQAILQAPAPSGVVEAYGRGLAVEPGSVRLEAAYVRRMVDFGLPEMAYGQAQHLVDCQPDNGLALAVVACVNGRRGETSEALTEIATAVKLLPGDPFVERTAGQLLAWFDTEADQSKIPDSVKQTVEQVRKELAARSTFADAYRDAHDFYQHAAGTEQAGQAGSVPVAPVPTVGTTVPETPYNSYTYNTYPPTYDGYAYQPAYPYPYMDYYGGYPYADYYGGYWGPIVGGWPILVPSRHFGFGRDADDFFYGGRGSALIGHHGIFDRSFIRGRDGGIIASHGGSGLTSPLRTQSGAIVHPRVAPSGGLHGGTMIAPVRPSTHYSYAPAYRSSAPAYRSSAPTYHSISPMGSGGSFHSGRSLAFAGHGGMSHGGGFGGHGMGGGRGR
jgi:hypothetical protein